MSVENADQADTGLGLKDFLAPKPSPEQKEPAAPVEKAASGEKAPVAPEGDKKKVEFLARADKKGEKADEKAPKEPAKSVEAAKAAEKPPAVAPTPEKPAAEAPKPVIDWESAENPYRKRYHDTSSWAAKVNQTNLSLQKQLEIINKKLDGTYDPDKDAAPQPSPEDTARLSAIVGRAEASLDAAYKEHGQEKVDAWITRYAEVFGQDPFVQQRILHSKMPVYEAIAAVKGYEFFSKHGSDPDKIMETIRAQLMEELTPKIREEEAAKFLEKANKREEEPKGLSKARAAGGGDAKPLPVAKPLKELFPR